MQRFKIVSYAICFFMLTRKNLQVVVNNKKLIVLFSNYNENCICYPHKDAKKAAILAWVCCLYSSQMLDLLEPLKYGFWSTKKYSFEISGYCCQNRECKQYSKKNIGHIWEKCVLILSFKPFFNIRLKEVFFKFV